MLIRELLIENAAQIQTWKNKVLAAVGSNGKVYWQWLGYQ